MIAVATFVGRSTCIGLLAVCGSWVMSAESLVPPGLIPGALNPRTDGQGNTWPFQANGMINNLQNSVLNYGFSLMAPSSGDEFQPSGPALVSKDGSLAVLQGELLGMQVTRLVRADQRLGVVRWVDVFKNSTAVQISGQVGFTIRLNSQAGQVVSEAGTSVSNALGPKEGALIITKPPQYRNNWTDLILLLADPAVKDKPTITNQNNYEFGITWNLTVAPGKAVAVMYGAALRPMANGPDTKEAQRLLVAASSRAFITDLPAALRRLIINWRVSGIVDDDQPAADIPEDLVAARGDSNLLALGASTRLRGTAVLAAGARLTLTVEGKPIELPWERILAIAGGRTARIFLQDGQSLSGTLAPAQVVFTLASGQAVTVSTERIGWLLRVPKPDHGSLDAPVLITTRDGVRLRAKAAADVRLRAGTPWGVVDLKLSDIANLVPADGGGCTVRLADGSRFHAHLAGDDLHVDTVLLGPRRIRLDQLVGMATPRPVALALASGAGGAGGAPSGTGDEADLHTPYVLLAGGQLLMGGIELPELHVRLAGNRLAVPPNQVRLLVNKDVVDNPDALSDEPPVRLELWGGDTVEGVLDEPVLPFRAGGTLLSVPMSEVIEIHVPTPVIAAATRTRISDLVAKLGDADWAKREAATKALGELGAVARKPLEEAQVSATDPEVKMRLEKLLGEMP